MNSGAGKAKPSTFLTVLLVVMSSYPPLSTDMYLPALTSIAVEFGAADSMANLTLVLFFIFFALATLLWGPVSDKYGRKPTLLTGIGLYSIASLGCVLSQSVHMLIFFRILQALGAGAPVTVSVAIVQDLYKGEQKKQVLAILGALMMVAPVVAPVMGTAVLSFSGWRIIFLFLMILGVLSFAGGLFVPETNISKTNKSVIKSFSGIFTVLKNSFFRQTVLVFSLPAVVILGFVGGSSSILMSGFGIPGSLFSLYFAANAVFSIIGSLLYVPFSRRISDNKLVYIAFSVTFISGILLTFFGELSPLSFMMCIFPATFVLALIRPLGMNIMMDKSGNDAGSASSIINFLFTLIGSISMELIAMEWSDRTFIYALLTMGTGLVSLSLWSFFMQRNK